MEQRIQILEEEVRLLKNQIRAVLLDIKENLASGDWQSHPANYKAADPSENSGQQPQEESFASPPPAPETKSIPASRIDQAGCDSNEFLSPPSYHTQTRPIFCTDAATQTAAIGHIDNTDQKQPDRNASAKASTSGLEPLTLMLLLQWLERAQTSLGKQQTQTLIELYCTTRDLPEQAKQTLQLLSALYGQDKDNNPDPATIPYLMELDQLLNNQGNNHAMQTTILELLMTKGKLTPVPVLPNKAKFRSPD